MIKTNIAEFLESKSFYLGDMNLFKDYRQRLRENGLSSNNTLEDHPFLHQPQYCIYAFKLKDLYIYIGRSNDPVERVYQHLGDKRAWNKSVWRSQVGDAYEFHYPHSREWDIYFYTLEDVEGILNQKFNGSIEYAEQEFIYRMGTVLNATYNVRRKGWPKSYRQKEIPEDSAALHLPHLRRKQGKLKV